MDAPISKLMKRFIAEEKKAFHNGLSHYENAQQSISVSQSTDKDTSEK